ncbi:MAG: hypothetical protein GY951_13065 [Psychromonas sp.]|nr:hypothetical protein [Psychromonas sp.]
MDTLFKFKQLYYFLLQGYEAWRAEIWDKDLDEGYCCDGRECLCQGETVREAYTYLNSNRS